MIGAISRLLIPPLLKLAVGADVLPFTIDLAADPASVPLYLDSFSKALAAGEPSAAAVADGGKLTIIAFDAYIKTSYVKFPRSGCRFCQALQSHG